MRYAKSFLVPAMIISMSLGCDTFLGIHDTDLPVDDGPPECVGCDQDGDSFCAAGIALDDFPGTCAPGGNDCDDTRDDVYPGAPESCGLPDFNCDGQRPAMRFDDVVPVRAHPGDGVHAAMASDGNQLVVAYIEKLAVNNAVRIATVSPSGAVSMGPISLSPEADSASAVDIDWDPGSGRFGVLYAVASAQARARVLYLTTLDANLRYPETYEIGPVHADNSNDIRLVAADGHFGIFYVDLVASSEVLFYRAFDTSELTVGEQRLIAARNLNNASIAWDGSYRFLVSWDASNGIMVAGVYVSSGGLSVSYKEVDLPNSETGYDETLRALGGKLYVTWRTPNTATSYCCDYLLRISKITNYGEFTGPVFTIASNASSGHMFLTQESEAVYGILYDQVSPEDTYALRRFTDSWGVISHESAWLENTYNVSRMSFLGNRYYFLRNSSSASYFTLYGVHKDWPGSKGNGVERELFAPVEPAESPLRSNYLLASYDPVSDEIEVLQQNPDDTSLLEAYRIDRTGAFTAPESRGEGAPDCGSYRVENGQLICYSLQAMFDWSDCYDEPGPSEGVLYQLRRYVYSEEGWSTSLNVTLPGLHWFDEFRYDYWCENPYPYYPVMEVASGFVVFARIPVHEEGEYFLRYVYRKFHFDNDGLTASEDIEARPEAVVTRGQDHLYVYKSMNSEIDQIEIRAQAINHETGLLDGPVVPVVSVSADELALSLESVDHDGEHVRMIYSTRELSGSSAERYFLMLIDPSNPGIVHGGPTEIPDVTGTNLELHGDHGYSLVTEAGKHVQRIRAYDASGNALEVGEINYTTDPDSAPSLQPFYTGTEVRVLLRYDNRILYTRGTCGDF